MQGIPIQRVRDKPGRVCTIQSSAGPGEGKPKMATGRHSQDSKGPAVLSFQHIVCYEQSKMLMVLANMLLLLFGTASNVLSVRHTGT